MTTGIRTNLVRLLIASVAAVAIIAAGTGCASGPPPQSGPHPFWPEAGFPVRVIHRMDITGPSDLGRPGLFDRLGAAIAGRSEHHIVRPQSLAVDDDERIYIVDQELQGVHVLKSGSVKGDYIDRAGGTYFVSPVGVAWCDGVLAVSDSALNKVFLLDGPKARHLATLDAPGDGFARPTGLAYDPKLKRLYVVDTLANEVVAFDMATRRPVLTIGGPGTEHGRFHFPTYAAVDHRGRLLVTDSLNRRVQAFEPDGTFDYTFGQAGNASGYLAVPKGVGVDSHGHTYIVDSYLSAVQVFDETGRLLLSFGTVGDERGQFQVPTGLTVVGDRIYVCDSQNARVQVFDYVGGPSDEDTSSH